MDELSKLISNYYDPKWFDQHAMQVFKDNFPGSVEQTNQNIHRCFATLNSETIKLTNQLDSRADNLENLVALGKELDISESQQETMIIINLAVNTYTLVKIIIGLINNGLNCNKPAVTINHHYSASTDCLKQQSLYYEELSIGIIACKSSSNQPALSSHAYSNHPTNQSRLNFDNQLALINTSMFWLIDKLRNFRPTKTYHKLYKHFIESADHNYSFKWSFDDNSLFISLLITSQALMEQYTTKITEYQESQQVPILENINDWIKTTCQAPRLPSNPIINFANLDSNFIVPYPTPDYSPDNPSSTSDSEYTNDESCLLS